MEAYTAELEQSFSRQLEARARAAGYEVEILNMGVGGYDTLQEYLDFQTFGQQYAPDLVLLVFHAINDVQDNSEEPKDGQDRSPDVGTMLNFRQKLNCEYCIVP